MLNSFTSSDTSSCQSARHGNNTRLVEKLSAKQTADGREIVNVCVCVHVSVDKAEMAR